ncbi:MAG TPA: mitochondrial fission ELM1 family protein [Dokdonella sp.]|uniref:mitochondrial fission ELM1 family protein n=1 Tax=Dokdonella sp. TaxID=2291710 RepID=UPI002D81109A|nr:mitochondrial fission ELM1 family protein [Dokdonella sp.]HET9034273.1 mitochondrial fission ELM1 family protein [Dokdonella sp.]
MKTAKANQLASVTTDAPCWVISDGAAGNEAQALALARALGLVPRVISLQVSHPWDWLAPRLRLAARRGMHDRHGGVIASPWPTIAIGCGRRAALLTRCLRDWSDQQCFTVQILDPRIAPAHFNVVIAPQHDHLPGDNVIETLGGLNAVDEAWLADGRSEFPSFSKLAGPRRAVLIGASNASIALDDAYFEALFAALERLHARHGGCFLVSTSRRTSRKQVERLRKEFSRWPGIFWGGSGDGENPYRGILGWAEQFIVSGDSVNMISEACATARPVHVFAPIPATGKIGSFHQTLLDQGYLTSVDGLADAASIKPLRETARVAAQVRQQWLHATKR